MTVHIMHGREKELAWLDAGIGHSEFSVLLLSGRPRVGKTTLVTEKLDEIEPSVYHLCDGRGTTANAKAFAADVAEAVEDVPPAVDDFRDALEYVELRYDEPPLIVLDEFSNVIERDPAVLDRLETVVDDGVLREETSIVLIASSLSDPVHLDWTDDDSSLSWPKSHRRMEPLTVQEASEFLSTEFPEELYEMYAILGGVPAYLDQFDCEERTFTNIHSNILTKGTFLYEEPHNLLHRTFRDPTSYVAILKAIAGGAHRVSDIAAEVDRDASSLTRYLQNLCDLCFVDHETPVTRPNGPGKYRISEPFFQFWFRYAEPHRDELERGITEPAIMSFIDSGTQNELTVYRPFCHDVVRSESFEYTCSRVGRWWNDDTEIDIVGIDRESNLLLFGDFVTFPSDVELPDFEVVNTIVEDVEWGDGDPTLVHAPFTYWQDLEPRAEYLEGVDAFHQTALTDVLY